MSHKNSRLIRGRIEKIIEEGERQGMWPLAVFLAEKPKGANVGYTTVAIVPVGPLAGMSEDDFERLVQDLVMKMRAAQK